MNFRTKLFDYEVEYINYHLHLHQNIEVDYWRDKLDCYIDWSLEIDKSTQGFQIANFQVDRVFMKIYFNIDIDDLSNDEINKICVDYNGDIVDRLHVVEGTLIIDTLVQKDWKIKMDLEYINRIQPREVFVNLMDREIVII